MSSLFDASSLLNENLAANATKREPLPMGETIAQIMKIEIKDGKAGPLAKNPGAPWHRLDNTLEITDPAYLSQIPGNPEKAICYHGIMLDIADGAIATGPNKNVTLGKWRDAAGANGKPLNMLVGSFIRIQIGHTPIPNDPDGGVRHEVIAFTKV
jgi:hypothetical protein